MNTRLNEILGIKYPIIQGGMAWVSEANLAAAVSEAGGLGIIAGGNAPKDVIASEIDKLRLITNKPFAINIMLLSQHVDDIIDLVIEKKVPIITTGAGNPGKYMKRLKSANIKVLPVVPSLALASRMEKIGADAVIVEGTEAGGHIGELTTMALTPQVVDKVDIPVIAAGGIADGRGVLAAFSLGAEGVQIGTRFICSNECIVHKDYKEKIIKSKDRDAIATGRSTGHPVRVLRNKFSKNLLSLEKKNTPIEELEKLGVGKLQLAAIDGDINEGSVMAGQIAGMINDIKPCSDIMKDLVDDYYKNLNRINNIKK